MVSGIFLMWRIGNNNKKRAAEQVCCFLYTALLSFFIDRQTATNKMFRFSLAWRHDMTESMTSKLEGLIAKWW